MDYLKANAAKTICPPTTASIFHAVGALLDLRKSGILELLHNLGAVWQCCLEQTIALPPDLVNCAYCEVFSF